MVHNICFYSIGRTVGFGLRASHIFTSFVYKIGLISFLLHYPIRVIISTYSTTYSTADSLEILLSVCFSVVFCKSFANALTAALIIMDIKIPVLSTVPFEGAFFIHPSLQKSYPINNYLQD